MAHINVFEAHHTSGLNWADIADAKVWTAVVRLCKDSNKVNGPSHAGACRAGEDGEMERWRVKSRVQACSHDLVSQAMPRQIGCMKLVAEAMVAAYHFIF